MPLTEERKMENETHIRWDETGELAVLWTASGGVAKQWRSYGFPVGVVVGGWMAKVPADRVTYKPMKKEQKS